MTDKERLEAALEENEDGRGVLNGVYKGTYIGCEIRGELDDTCLDFVNERGIRVVAVMLRGKPVTAEELQLIVDHREVDVQLAHQVLDEMVGALRRPEEPE